MKFDTWRKTLNFCCGGLKTVKQTGKQIEANFVNDVTGINFELITQLQWMHILYFKLACINPSDRFQTLATNGLKPRIFSSNLLLVSQE